MKTITKLCLIIGLMIACTDKESVDFKEQSSQQEIGPEILYRGKLYKYDDAFVREALSPSSITLQIDFESYLRLFDSETDLRAFLKQSYDGRFERGNLDLLEEKPMVPLKDVPVVTKSLPQNTTSKTGRTQNNINDFELIILNGVCTAYPLQAWYVNLPSYPSGTITNIKTTVGYIARSFAFTVPNGGAIHLSYKGVGWPVSICEKGLYIATTSGCHNPFYFSCFPMTGPVNQLTWSVDVN